MARYGPSEGECFTAMAIFVIAIGTVGTLFGVLVSWILRSIF